MDNFFRFILIVITITVIVLLGVVLFHDLNLSGDAIGQYSGTYCDIAGCDSAQTTVSSYLYPEDTPTCPQQASVFQYFMTVGKVSVPIYEVYNLQEGSCHVTLY